jgi:1-acyl-sn-glycerol-3-phosphate acyltransferase
MYKLSQNKILNLETDTNNFENDKSGYNQHFNPIYTKQFIENIITPISKVWFRPQFVGFEDFPQRNNPEIPLIFATNHSGMAFPWDVIIFSQEFITKFDFGKDALRVLVSPTLTHFRFMSAFLIKNIWLKAGGVNATMPNFEKMMQDNSNNLLICPEGVPGIGKGFDKRYQLQDFKTSFVRMAIKYKTDIIPFATVNGEFINPLSYKSKKLNKLAQSLGLPFLPKGITTILAILQPWFFYVALPAKLTFICGKRIKFSELTDKPYEEISHSEFKIIAENVRIQMQKHLSEVKNIYGKKPYRIGELLKKMFLNIRYFHKYFISFWAITFTDFDDRFQKNQDLSKYKANIFRLIAAFFNKPILFLFYLPIIGWIPIFYICYKEKNRKIF